MEKELKADRGVGVFHDTFSGAEGPGRIPTGGAENVYEAEPGLGFLADGEIIGRVPAGFTVLPRNLKVIVGPGYTPEPRPAREMETEYG